MQPDITFWGQKMIFFWGSGPASPPHTHPLGTYGTSPPPPTEILNTPLYDNVFSGTSFWRAIVHNNR